MVDKTVVKVLTSQVGVTSSGLDFENTVIDCEEGNTERPPTEVKDQNIALSRNLLLETIGDGSGGRFADDIKDIKAGNGTGILGCLTLRAVEVNRDSNDGVSNSVAQICFRSFLHLEENHGGDFFRRLSWQSECGRCH